MKVYYFDAYGRAEQIRILLNHAGAEYEDVRYTREKWAEVKSESGSKFEYGQVPALEKDGKVYVQSDAILRLLGREYGYYPTDAVDAYRVDNLIDLTGDFRTPIMTAFFSGGTDEEKKKKFEDLVANHFPKFFGFWEKKLLENSSQDFLVGDSATIADFAYLAIYSSLINNGQLKDALLGVLEGFPTLNAYFTTRWNAQKDYFDHRPASPF